MKISHRHLLTLLAAASLAACSSVKLDDKAPVETRANTAAGSGAGSGANSSATNVANVDAGRSERPWATCRSCRASSTSTTTATSSATTTVR